MRKNILKVMLCACLGISMVSCNNVLDVDPQDALDTERVYSSVSNFEKECWVVTAFILLNIVFL